MANPRQSFTPSSDCPTPVIMDPIESSDSPPCPLAPILEHLEALVRPVWNGGMAVEWSPEEIAEVGANLDLVWSQLKKIPLPAKC